MMGVAFDPNFDENRRIYVYATSNMSDPHTNRLMRFVVNEDFSGVSERTDIVDDVPYKMAASDHPFGGPGAHNGGRVRFNPVDGYLYLTTGDNHNSEIPQSPTMMGSKVIRIDTDGNAAPENAPPEGFDKRTYTYGHRNVQGIAFNATGTPITAEHGPWHSDEITVLENGGNAGWDPRPNMAGRDDCPDDYCGYSPNQAEGMNRFERAAYMPMTDFETYPDAMPPIWNNNGWSQGTSSAAFLTGEAWGDWNGALVVGIMGIGFGGRNPLTTAIRGVYFGRKAFASITGISMVPMNVLLLVSPLFAGIMFDATGTYTASFAVVAAVSLIGSALFLLLGDPTAAPAYTSPEIDAVPDS